MYGSVFGIENSDEGVVLPKTTTWPVVMTLNNDL